MQKLVLSRLHVLLRTRSALEMGHRHSVRPGYFEERRGPPRLLGHPLHTCRGATPRRNQPLLAHSSLGKIHGEAGIAFTQLRTLGNRNDRYFEATHPRPTCSRAYASPTSLPRPSQGSLPARAGSPLAGRDSHPRDSKQNLGLPENLWVLMGLGAASPHTAQRRYPPFTTAAMCTHPLTPQRPPPCQDRPILLCARRRNWLSRESGGEGVTMLG